MSGVSLVSKIIPVLLILFLFTSFSCKDDPVKPPDNVDLSISVEDVSCIEAWISLKEASGTELKLFRNDSLIKALNTFPLDTIIYDEGLLPNQSYAYKAEVLFNNKTYIKETTAQTMDTTSHSYAWQSWEFGQHSSSQLFDVAIIDENNIWAVGEIYMNDSLGQVDPHAYNAVHWDGINWELKRIYYYGDCSAVKYPSLKAIWAFSADNMILTNGGSVGWFNGDSITLDCRVNMLLDGAINQIWGTSSNNIYVVGNNGSIAHFDGTSWKKIESGTDTDMKDIYGTPDGKEIWTCGWSSNDGHVSIISIKDDKVESIWDSHSNRTLRIYSGLLLNTLWANGNGEFIFATGEILRHSLLDTRIVRQVWIPIPNGKEVLYLGNYAHRIRGSNKNNIAIAGDEAMLWHFNGRTWYKFEELNNQEDRLYGLAVFNDLIVAVGKRYSGLSSGALILIGRN